MTGKLFLFEGADASGKQTQAGLAIEALRSKGRGVAHFDFPQYGKTLSGDLVRDALNGKLGDFRGLDPKMASVPYILDRVTARDELMAVRQQCDIVLNRYTPSNMAFQGGKCSTKEAQDEFIAWLEKLEYDEHGLPRPDLVLYLYVPYDVSRRLIDEREKAAGAARPKDQHEVDESFQRRVIDLYLRLADERDDWRVIECTRNGDLLSREEIHTRAMQEIEPYL